MRLWNFQLLQITCNPHDSIAPPQPCCTPTQLPYQDSPERGEQPNCSLPHAAGFRPAATFSPNERKARSRMPTVMPRHTPAPGDQLEMIDSTDLDISAFEGFSLSGKGKHSQKSLGHGTPLRTTADIVHRSRQGRLSEIRNSNRALAERSRKTSLVILQDISMYST